MLGELIVRIESNPIFTTIGEINEPAENFETS